MVLNSNSLLVDEELQQSSFHPDFLDDYDGAKEEIGTGFPDPYMVVMNWNLQYFLMPTSHAHHHLMRRSITGIMVFVGSTPVLWPSKHQGCIATSVEEAISIRYMLRCLGVPVTKPTNLYGDKFGVIQSATIPDGELKKKHAFSNFVPLCSYVKLSPPVTCINAIWVKSHENFVEVCTKALGTIAFFNIIHNVMVSLTFFRVCA